MVLKQKTEFVRMLADSIMNAVKINQNLGAMWKLIIEIYSKESSTN